MLFLFLDCEMTGLTKSDQIIEIGAVLVELDEQNWQMSKISEFETLVKINSQIDDKISRITGIDNKLLFDAPKLEIAQKRWQSWLVNEVKNWQNKNNFEDKFQTGIEKNNQNEVSLIENKLPSGELNWQSEQKDYQIAIVGHSLDFDLGFLARENWFLPEIFVKIDTLDLSKIFLPFVEAVNLEFLTKKLDLTEQNNNWSKKIEYCAGQNLNQNSDQKNQDKKVEATAKNSQNLNNDLEINSDFHRAKFDAQCSWLLLEYLLDFFLFCYVLDREKNYFTDQFLVNLQEFLPLSLVNIKKITQNIIHNPSKNLQLNLQKFGILEDRQILQKSEIPSDGKILEKHIDFEGLEILSFSQKLANWSKIEPDKLQQILCQKLPKSLNLLTLQLFFIAFVDQNWEKLENKLENDLKPRGKIRFIKNNTKNNTKTSTSTNSVPNLKLHTQKDLFLIAELFLENLEKY